MAAEKEAEFASLMEALHIATEYKEFVSTRLGQIEQSVNIRLV